jgi:hypothetical protein
MWLLRNILFYTLVFAVFQFSAASYLNGFQFSFTHLLYQIAAGVLLLVLLFKLKIKWTGINALNSKSTKYNFVYTAKLSKPFLSYTRLFYGTEVIISIAAGLLFLFFDKDTWMFSGLLLINGAEGLYYLMHAQQKGKFRIAVNDNAVVHNARGIYVLPFHELKRIEFKYDEFFFIYNDEETLTLPYNVVSADEIEKLKSVIAEKVKEKGIYHTVKLQKEG